MNGYRNWQFHQNNDYKIRFKEQVLPLIPDVRYKEIKIEYKVFFKTKRVTDVANVCSVVDKFFSDTLVSSGVVEDDNYLFLKKVVYEFGGIDKDNPRVEATITEV